MTAFRALVVDDEPLAREVVVNLLRADREIEAVFECGDGAAAKETAARERPDIVFLDIEMPGESGIAVADAIQAQGPVVVLVTAFDRYAVEAFDVAATDYVLKPFSDDRFHEALQRAKRRVRERRLGALAGEMAAVATELHYAQTREEPRGPQVLDRITIRQGDRSLVVRADEILWIEAEDYCVMIHSTRGRHLVRASLASLESRLDPAAFVRVHRTAIVNVLHVREIRDRDGMCLTLTDGSQVAVSRARKRQVEEALGPRLR